MKTSKKGLKSLISVIILGFVFTGILTCNQPSYPPEPANTYFFDDFESYETEYPHTTWTPMYKGISAEISSEKYVSPTHSFKLSAYCEFARSDYMKIGYIRKFYYEAEIYVEQKTAAIGFSIFREKYNPTYNMIKFQHDKNIYFKGKEKHLIQSFNYERWYTVKVYIDYTDLTADVYIDGIKKGENLEIYPYSFYDNEWGEVTLNIFTLHIPNFDSGVATAYFDDIAIVEIEGPKKYFPSVLTFLSIFIFLGVCTGIVYRRKPQRFEKVNTFRVALLGFSLISIVVLELLVTYIMFFSVTGSQMSLNYQETTSRILELNINSNFSDMKVAFTLFFILPQIISLILWALMPYIIKYWYSLEPVPSRYNHVHTIVQKLASRMEIPSPALLYTPKKIVNCFNVGRWEGESTLVLSNWLINNLTTYELEAVIAHEIAHTKNRDVTLMAYLVAVKWALLLTPVFILCYMLLAFFMFGSFFLQILLIPMVWGPVIIFFTMYFLLVLGIHWFSRLREAAADARASLFVDKNILKNVLYRLAGERSMRILFASCLMISNNRRFGSIFSTHPSIVKRNLTLENEKYIIDYKKSPSFTSMFTLALSIYVFLQLINFIVGTFTFGVTGDVPGISLLLLDSIIIAVLLVLYYDYLSLKFLGKIIVLIILIQFVSFFVFGVPILLITERSFYPVIEIATPAQRDILVQTRNLLSNFSETLKVFLLIDTVLLSITAFLMTGFFKYIGKLNGKDLKSKKRDEI
ncbi:MAG: M48 family metalloprotease [Candidatus Methanofastidiosia archaeon]|jgi:heat shock protein HtpX